MLHELRRLISVTPDIQLAGVIAKNLPRTSGRPEHLFVTDLSNPKQAFYERTGAGSLPSAALLARYEVGNIMHSRFSKALRGMKGAHANEAPMDGALVDIPGIRGRIDQCMGDALLEFKTSPYLLDTPEQVWSTAPQYVAQLLVYAAIWTADQREHLLVIMNVAGSKPGPIRVYRVRIKDLRRLRQNVAQLRDRLFKCIDEEGPEDLGDCAYHDNHCPFQAAGSCNCKSGKTILRDALGDGVELRREETLEAEFQARLDSMVQVRGLIPWELAIPRQRYILEIFGEDWIGRDGPDPAAPSRSALQSALAAANILAEATDVTSLEAPTDPALETGIRWLKIPKSKGRETAYSLAPALLRRWNELEEPTESTARAHAQQAAAVAAYWDLPHGYVLYHAPKLDPPIRTFRSSVKEAGVVRDLVVNAIHVMRKAIEGKNVEALPECPDFAKRRCNLTNCACK